ncbi:MAG TPA: exonuclease domain-containing protein, partial [Paracoccus sp. (in: a-proteobacteria)]|nr:exonuclease domain-containing protein [Paracoccus sp. (in: a-proteobacteria)]
MRPDRCLIAAVLAPGLALAAWLGLGTVILAAALAPEQRARLGGVLAPLAQTHGMLAVGWWMAAAVLSGWAVHSLYRRLMVGPARLATAARILAQDAGAPDLPAGGGRTMQALAGAVNSLAAQRRDLQADMARLVDEASHKVAEQRDQLAALMTELNHAVIVCNLDGRILLYNGRVRDLLRRLSPRGVAGAELVGLGRPIEAVIDRAPIDYALETVRGRLARGVDASAAAARFVTTAAGGQLLQVSLAPVRPAGAEGTALSGFILTLDDVTVEHEAQSRRDRALLQLTEASRASVASLQAALEMLDYPDLSPEERDRFLAVIRDEVGAMGNRLAELTESSSQELMTRWPLQEMRGADLIAAAARRIEDATFHRVETQPVDGELWLSVDSFGLIETLAYLAARLAADAGRPDLWLRLTLAGSRAHLDLGWSGGAIASETLIALQSEPMQIPGHLARISVRDVMERHGGEVWLERERAGEQPFFRLLLPLAAVETVSGTCAIASRPEFYDFELFAADEGRGALDDRPLAALAFTVFDTETTGLDPAGGDEIIQIGAVRVLNGRILRGETIDQLVDPQRSIPEAGIPIHGIHPHMVRGQPTIAEALPGFHAFAQGSVLVGHNLAFDMRFLRL